MIKYRVRTKHMVMVFTLSSLLLFSFGGCTRPEVSPLAEQTIPVSREPVVLLGKSLPAPSSMAEFLSKADAIVIGTVGKSFREVMEGPYNADSYQDPRDVPSPELPFTYYEVQIEEIILNDGTIIVDKPLSLRVSSHPGSLEAEKGEWEMPHPGERYLFVMRRNPDGQSYGTNGGWGMLHIDEPVIRFANREQPLVTFADKQSPQDFIEELKKTLQVEQSKQ